MEIVGNQTSWSVPVGNIPKLIAHTAKRYSMLSSTSTIASFLVALIISTVIIYLVTKLLGEKEGLGTAILAALIGTAVYTLFYYVLGQGLIAAFIAGIVWLIALQRLYSIGWIKSLIIAIAIWIVTSVAGWFLPALLGPV
jgi:hypothetical protein